MLGRGGDFFHYASGYSNSKITATSSGYSEPEEFCANDAYELVLEKYPNENGFRIKTNEGYLQHNTGTDIKSNVLNDSYDYTWTIDIIDGIAYVRPIPLQGGTTYDNYIVYSSSGFIFSQVSSKTYPVILYRKVIAKATSSGYATFCSSKDITLAGGGMKAFVGNIVGDELVLTEVNNVKANEGVILYSATPNSAAEVTVTTLTDDEKAPFNTNDIKAATTAVTVDNDGVYYALTNDSNGDAVFCPVEPGIVIPVGKAYLHINANAPAKISLSTFTPTNLSTERYTSTSTDAYNLSGQKVGSGYHGIVITNGRKVIK